MLTLFLVLLYFRQTDIQEKQVEIMETQEKLMETNQLPQIDIDAFYPFALSSVGDLSENAVTVSLENVGNGVGINPHLGIEGAVDYEGVEIEPVFRQMEVESSDTGETDPHRNLSSALKPGESRIYRTPVTIHTNSELGGYVNDFAYSVYKRGATRLELRLSVGFDDLAGNTREFEILDLDIDLTRVDSSAEGELSKEDFSFRHLFRIGLEGNAERPISFDSTTPSWPNKTDLIIKNLLIEGHKKVAGENREE